ncbi:MAG: cysteine desulfurase, partial [Firmicutes bacterium]|nr:cysteine desulfurase [Candidatus Caballimonas caccae]
MAKEIYFDHASTTPVDREVLDKMLPYFTDIFGNPNSQHGVGRKAVKAVDKARDDISCVLNCKPNEVYFTSGGTEGDNFALKGIAYANKNKCKHIIISSIEHAGMIESAKALEKDGFNVDYIKVDSNGIIDIKHLEQLLKKETLLVGVMMANNEVGTIQPIKEISKIVHNHNAIMFTDAVQTAGVLDIDVKELGVDVLTLSSHKIYGPKGVGAIYVKNGILIDSLISGGHQERAKRGGTTNTAGVVGLSVALTNAEKNREKNFIYVSSLRDRFIEKIEKEIPCAFLNGDRNNRLPANANFTFNGISGEELLFNLDIEGVCASLGSACSSGSIEPSHVLLAMGKSKEEAKSSVRFTFGKDNTIEEIDKSIEIIKDIV